jgi:hypothetical protein
MATAKAPKKFVPSAPKRAPAGNGQVRDKALRWDFGADPEVTGTILRAKTVEGRFGPQTRVALDVDGEIRVAWLPSGYEGLDEHVESKVTIAKTLTGNDVEGKRVEWLVTLA